jgi:hypothetical protein
MTTLQDLIPGKTYFLVVSVDPAGVVPHIASLVYLGKEQAGVSTAASAGPHRFQEAVSYFSQRESAVQADVAEPDYEGASFVAIDESELHRLCDLRGVIAALSQLQSNLGVTRA